jgi:ParB/RepB/Spo0J family partition protein
MDTEAVEEQQSLWPQERPRGKAEDMSLDQLPGDSFIKAPTWMVESIKHRGVVVPIIVLDLGDDGYIVIDGKRRLAAARKLKLATIPARVFDALDWANPEALTVALNEERAPNQIAEFDSVIILRRRGFSEQEVARATGLSVPSIVGYDELEMAVRKDIIDGVRRGKVRFTTLRQIARLTQQSQAKLAVTLDQKGTILGRDVKPLLEAEETAKDDLKTAELFGDDPLVQWTNRALQAMHDLVSEAPAGAMVGPIAHVIASLEGVPVPFVAQRPENGGLN